MSEKMTLQEAIYHMKMEDWRGEEYQGHDEAFALVLSAAEKQIEDGPKAELLDAKEWWADLSYYEAQPYIAERHLQEPLNDFIIRIYRKAKEEKK
jgi:hypothetical protein